MTEQVWFRGNMRTPEEPLFAAQAPAWRHGSGCFTTARWHKARMIWRTEHLKRLRETLAFFGASASPDWEADIEAAEQAFDADGRIAQGTLRIALADTGSRWEPILTLVREPMPPGIPTGGLRVALTDPHDPIFQVPPLGRWKLASYFGYREAMRRVRAEAFNEGLLWHVDGSLAEAIHANVFVRLDGHWHTPELRPTGPLPGITRAHALAWLRSRGERVIEGKITRPDLLRCDALLLSNARCGLIPVGCMGRHSFDSAIPVEMSVLAAAFEAALPES